jgi:hypothetical protein
MSAIDQTIVFWLRGALLSASIVAASSFSGTSAQPNPAPANLGGDKMAFLSERQRQQEQPAEGMLEATPPQDNTSFDGAWIFTSGGCTRTGSLPARIRRGKIIIRGGSGFVDADGTLHSVGAGGGMTLTAVGQLSGNTGSGTFNRSDGCIGTWIAIKR